MSVHKAQPPWEFLLSASRTSLQSFELSRLSHAANLRKEITQLLDSWLEENSAAMLARWLMEQREEQREQTLHAPGAQTAAESRPGNAPGASHSVSDNFLADRPASRHHSRGSV